MVGFEDSVNMVEETKDPQVFPKIMLSGLTITGIIYVLVSIVAVAAVPIGVLKESKTPLLEVFEAGAPGLPIDEIFPFLTMFAVANTALINMLMASRLLYGMSKQNVLPPVFAKVLKGRRSPWVSILFTTLIAFVLIIAVSTFLPETVIASSGRNHVAAASGRLRSRQLRGPRAAQEDGRAQALPRPHLPAVAGRLHLLVPRRAVGPTR